MPVFRHAQPHESGESRLGVLWICSALSALVLCLAVNGTLSSWTQAIVTHNENEVSTGSGTIALKVSLADGTTCTSSDAAGNSSACSIDLFGINGTAVRNLQPGGTATTTVTLTNIGDSSATTLNMAPGDCLNADALCNNLSLVLSCAGAAATTFSGTMTQFASADRDLTKLLPTTVFPSLGDVTVCTFTITLPLLAPPSTSGQTLSQDVVWTLS
jgi:hypothetical protein